MNRTEKWNIPQHEAGGNLIRFRKSMNNGQQPVAPLSRRHLFFRIRCWVQLLFRNRAVGGCFGLRSLVRVKLFQRETMSDAEDPAAKVLPRSA